MVVVILRITIIEQDLPYNGLAAGLAFGVTNFPSFRFIGFKHVEAIYNSKNNNNNIRLIWTGVV